MTLDQWGLAIVAASKKVPKEKLASFDELLRLFPSGHPAYRLATISATPRSSRLLN
jgi:hypothetical protein